jgi:hypothetical protein
MSKLSLIDSACRIKQAQQVLLFGLKHRLKKIAARIILLAQSLPFWMVSPS